ncbi:thiol-disulfide oxidoreductase DCC family protein [Aurantiacibacter flavus]|uniref:Thiol-disulfide oxidoreductase DCC family protein n=1 Tax=Aurantiacibacter flavus TaxID=3145232 RepID=A0ABV0CTB0_9SPHN
MVSGPFAIVLFDGECVLCSANAQFILTHDRQRRFKLAAMQGEVGARLFRQYGLDPMDPDSILLIDGGEVLAGSDAVLGIFARLGWPWQALSFARIIPRVLRDPAYRWLARNRYRLFGKRETCWVPRPEHVDRML